MPQSYSILEKRIPVTKVYIFSRSLSTHFLSVLNSRSDFKILTVRHAKVRYFRKLKITAQDGIHTKLRENLSVS
jgi:hypothetical protein